MIHNLKLKNHKGIKVVKLYELGQINVICGKNNSGKSSLMEAINIKDKYSLGRVIDSEGIGELTVRFKDLASGYSNPLPQQSMAWFNQAIHVKLNHIVFEDDVDSLARDLGEDFQKATRHGPTTFNFKDLFKNYILNGVDFRSVLISPKRSLNSRATIQDIAAAGPTDNIRILSRLFSLSTQNNKSPERKIYDAIQEAFSEITDGFNFHIGLNRDQAEIQFSRNNDDWILAEDSGLGLRDILVILSYLLDSSYTVILIEEPENHIHPEMQRKLLRFISTVKNKQVFLTTHSNVLLDPTYVKRVFYAELKDKEIITSDQTSRTSILSDLGYSVIDNLVADLIVLTEGPTDIPVIKEICIKLGFLHKYNVKFYPLGGDNMHHLDLSVFAERSEVFAIVDSDPGSSRIREKFKKVCADNNIPLTILTRMAIENYFSLDAIRKIYPHQEIVNRVDALKPDVKVEEQLGFNVKARNREVAEAMTLKDFENTDLLDFCEGIRDSLEKKE